MRGILVDTSPLVAAADRDDRRHRLARQLLEDLSGPLVVPTPVLTEAEYMIRTRVGERAARSLLADADDGLLSHSAIEAQDLHRALAIIDTHPGMRLGLADASIVAQAERMKIGTIFTFDHADFRRIRPTHVPYFELVPSESDLFHKK